MAEGWYSCTKFTCHGGAWEITMVSRGELPMLPDVLTRWSIFSLSGKLTGYLPVCCWLGVATAFERRHANSVTAG